MRTRQLAAHYAAIQVDSLLETVVLAYLPTRDMLVGELAERFETRWGDTSFDAIRHRLLRVRQIVRLRAAIVALADVLDDVRADLGTDKADLPDGHAHVRAALARLREAERPVDDPGVSL